MTDTCIASLDTGEVCGLTAVISNPTTLHFYCAYHAPQFCPLCTTQLQPNRAKAHIQRLCPKLKVIVSNLTHPCYSKGINDAPLMPHPLFSVTRSTYDSNAKITLHALKKGAESVRQVFKLLCDERKHDGLTMVSHGRSVSWEPLPKGSQEWSWTCSRGEFKETSENDKENEKKGFEAHQFIPNKFGGECKGVSSLDEQTCEDSHLDATLLVSNIMTQVEQQITSPWPPRAPKAANGVNLEKNDESLTLHRESKVQLDDDEYEQDISIPPAFRHGLPIGPVQRHGLQHQALLGLASKFRTFSSTDIICEAGAGKAGLLHAIVALQHSQRFAACSVQNFLNQKFKNDDMKAEKENLYDSSIGQSKLFVALDSDRFSNRADPHIHHILKCIQTRKGDMALCDQQSREIPLLTRLRTDLRDFNLVNIDASENRPSVSIVGKHLCGGATDATLRMLVHTLEGRTDASGEVRVPERAMRVNGLLVATCCHHRCTWDSFVHQRLLKQWGVTENLFQHMTKWSSWFTSHEDGEAEQGEGVEDQKGNCKNAASKAVLHEIQTVETDDTLDQFEELEPREAYFLFAKQLKEEEKAELGFKSKLIFDAARAVYLAQAVTTLPLESPASPCVNRATVRLVRYCDTKITKENLAIIATFEYNKTR